MIDVLLSIPFLSYIFFPTAAASASTSVNIILLYVTWSSLVFSHHPLQIHLSGLLVLRLIFWLVPSLASLALDLGAPSLAAGLKHGGRSSLPPRDARRLAGLLGLALLNVVLWMAAEAALGIAYALVFGRHLFGMSTALPLPWTVAKHCSFILVSREVLQYHLHRRVLHGNNYYYSGVAKRHGTWAHGGGVGVGGVGGDGGINNNNDNTPGGAPYSLQVFADHPLALFFHRFLPVFLPSALIRTHMLTYFFIIVTTVEETLAMSGYTFVPGVVMSGITARTAIHYAGKGSSNYGAVGIMDWAHGTSKGRHVLDDVKKEADKHDVPERSARKVGAGSNAVKDGVGSLKKRVKSTK